MGSPPLQHLVFGRRGDADSLLFRRHKDREVLTDFATDIQRMKACLQAAGYDASEADIAAAWTYHSENIAAGWLMLPESDWELLTDLLRNLNRAPRQSWRVAVLEADDGSGDQILNLPDDLISGLGWAIGDELTLPLMGNSEIQLQKKNSGQ